MGKRESWQVLRPLRLNQGEQEGVDGEDEQKLTGQTTNGLIHYKHNEKQTISVLGHARQQFRHAAPAETPPRQWQAHHAHFALNQGASMNHIPSDLTRIDRCDSFLFTGKGRVSYLEWCKAEVKRIGRSANVRLSDDGKKCCVNVPGLNISENNNNED